MKVVRIDRKMGNLPEDLAQAILEYRNIIQVANPDIVGTWL